MPATSGRQTHIAAILNAGASIVSGGLSVLALLLVARMGREAELGAYTAGTVTSSVAAFVLTCGTTLHYTIATERERVAVQQWRLRRVAPVMISLSMILALVYAHRGFDGPAVLAAGLAIAFNSLSEIHYANLQRRLRYGFVALSVVGSKLIVLAAVSRINLSYAILVAACGQLFFLELTAPWAISTATTRPLKGTMLHYGLRPAAPLAAYTISDGLAGRFDSLLISLTSTPSTTGRYGLIYSIFSSIAGILYAATQVILPFHHRVLGDRALSRRPVLQVQWATTAVAGIGSVLTWFLGPTIVAHALGHRDAEAALWLRLLGLALPFLITARSVALRKVAERSYRQAMLIIVPAVLTGLAVYCVMIPLSGPIGGPIGTLVQEVSACIAGLLILRSSSLRLSPSSECVAVGDATKPAVEGQLPGPRQSFES